MTEITIYLQQGTQLIFALGSFISAIIVTYLMIKQKIKYAAKDELERKVYEAMAESKTNVGQMALSLKDRLDMSQPELCGITGRKMLIAAILREREPKLIRKAGVQDGSKLNALVSVAVNKAISLI